MIILAKKVSIYMKKQKELVIFDLDGTIIDSAPSLHNALNFMLKELNLEPIELEVAREYIGNGAQVLVKRVLVRDFNYEKHEIDEQLFKKALDILLSYYGKNLTEHTVLYNGAKETLEALQNAGYKMAIATNKPNQFVQEILEYFDIAKYFDYVIGSGVVEHRKPHPAMLLKVCEELAIKPQNSIMVGDTINDILGAKNANMDSIALTHGYTHIDLSELNPTYICNDFKEITEILV
jgi:phosphoglycolate phosphatase